MPFPCSRLCNSPVVSLLPRLFISMGKRDTHIHFIIIIIFVTFKLRLSVPVFLPLVGSEVKGIVCLRQL